MLSRVIVTPANLSSIARKLALLILYAGLVAVVVAIMPYIATLAPAIHAKELMLRVVMLTLIPALCLAGNRMIIRPLTLIDAGFAALLAANLISAIVSSVRFYSLSQHWYLILLSSIGWLYYRLSPSRRELLTALLLITTVGFLSALYGFLTYKGVDPLRRFYPFQFDAEQAGGRNYIHSFFGNPEYFGGFAAPCAFIAGALTLYKPLPLWVRAVCLGKFLLIALVIALAGARMALIGMAAAWLLSVPIAYATVPPSWHRMLRWGALAGAIVIAAGITILSTSNPLNPREVRLIQRFSQAGDLRSDSVRERIVFYTSTAEGISQNFFFGYGPGTFRLQFFENMEILIDKDPRAGASRLAISLNNRLAEHAHNDYLEFWFETGTLGFAALLFIISLILYHGARLYWPGMASPEDRLLATMFFGGSICLLLNAFSSFPLHMPARGYLGWFLIGGFFAAIPLKAELTSVSPGKPDKTNETKG